MVLDILRVIHQLLRQQNEREYAPEAGHQLAFRHSFESFIAFETHRQHQDIIKERLTAGQAVGIVHAVPDVIRNIQGKAEEHYTEQHSLHDLLLVRNSPVQIIHREEQQRSHSAVQVRPVIQSDFALHIHQMSGKHIEYREIGRQRFWKGAARRSGSHQCVRGRQQQDCSQTAGNQRIQSEASALYQELLQRHMRKHDHQADKVQEHKDAQHDGDIVVGKNRQSQRDAVQERAVLFHQALQSEENQRCQPQAVQPHDIPAVGGHVSAQRIADAEESNPYVICVIAFSEIPCHGESAQADLQNNQICHELDDQAGWEY